VSAGCQVAANNQGIMVAGSRVDGGLTEIRARGSSQKRGRSEHFEESPSDPDCGKHNREQVDVCTANSYDSKLASTLRTMPSFFIRK
jgi:hypothetical protein